MSHKSTKQSECQLSCQNIFQNVNLPNFKGISRNKKNFQNVYEKISYIHFKPLRNTNRNEYNDMVYVEQIK